MVKNSRQPGTGNQKWQCAVKNKARAARWYDGLNGVEFNALLLERRRTKALRRMKQREERHHRQVQGEGRNRSRLEPYPPSDHA